MARRRVRSIRGDFVVTFIPSTARVVQDVAVLSGPQIQGAEPASIPAVHHAIGVGTPVSEIGIPVAVLADRPDGENDLVDSGEGPVEQFRFQQRALGAS